MKPSESGVFAGEASPFLDETPLQIALRPEPESLLDEETIVRLATPWFSSEIAAESLTEEEAWSGSTEQIEFRERVLSAHLERSKADRGAPQRDLRAGELRNVRGTGISMALAAADAASLLIEAANQALAAARTAGDADALRTTRISANSGYRDSDYQRMLWRGDFPGYYKKTRKDREAMAAGPHSIEAVTHMLDVFGIPDKIAAPGYSKHQAGIAIDLTQERTKPYQIENNTESAWRLKWRNSWFHGWLIGNAAAFGFVPYRKEEWHWEYKPKAAPKLKGSAASHRTAPDPPGDTVYQDIDLKIGGVKPKTGIFVPDGYRPRASVDLIIYLHGHTASYPGAKTSIDTYWADPNGWFPLRELVNQSAKNIVLVAPTLGPKSEAGTLDDAGGLDSFVGEVLNALTGKSPAFENRRPQIDNIILAGHSGAGKPMLKIASSGSPMSGKIRECWLFDALYGDVEAGWEKWLRTHPQATLYNYHATEQPTVHSERLEKALGKAAITNAVFFPRVKSSEKNIHYLVPKMFFATRLRDTSWLSEIPAFGPQQKEAPASDDEYVDNEYLMEEEELESPEDEESEFSEDGEEQAEEQEESDVDSHELFADEEGFREDGEESPSFEAETIFPSGESLSIVTGLPEEKDQDYWDPTNSHNPLLDTGPAHKDKRLSRSFTVRELTTSGGVSADVARIDPKLVECVQLIRDHVGKPITIISGYRSWKRNKQVYAGKTNPDGTPRLTRSQHCGGRAVDIRVEGMSGLEIGKAAIDACGPDIGVGLAKTFAHIDVRGEAKAWNYGGVSASWVSEILGYQKEKRRSRTPAVHAAPPAKLKLRQRVPDKSENATVGAIAKKIIRNDARFRQLVVSSNPDIVFKDEENTGADMYMTPRLREKLDKLAALVKKEWPDVKLRVTEAWDENNEHNPTSTHYEGRAADLTTSDTDKAKLGRLAGLAVAAGLDWVFYENSQHVHVSVKK
jgi:uncharacterized protein YcbK (DUF882 family)